jgi:hypothetical protein
MRQAVRTHSSYRGLSGAVPILMMLSRIPNRTRIIATRVLLGTVFLLTGCETGSTGMNAPTLFQLGGAQGSSSGASSASDDASNKITLFGAGGEVLDFSLTLNLSGNVDVRVGDFVSASGQRIEEPVAVYRRHYVLLDEWPGWYLRWHVPAPADRYRADVLVPVNAPRGGLPTRAQPNRPLGLWFDVSIPRDTPPDQYTTTVEVLVDGKVTERREVALRVLPFSLPDDVGAALLADVDHRALFAHHVKVNGRPCVTDRVLLDHPAARDLARVLMRTMRMLHDHQLTPQLPDLHPIVKVGGNQEVTVNWTDYDRVVGAYLDGSAFADRKPLRWWGIPLDEHFPDRPDDVAALSPAYARLVQAYLRDAGIHFEQRGWLDQAYMQAPFGGAMSPAAQDAVRHYGYIARRAGLSAPVMSTLFPQDASAAGWTGFPYKDLRDEVDVWCPDAQYFDRQAIFADLGARAWLGVDRPPFSGTTSAVGSASDARVIPWQARTGNVAVVRLGCANPWPRRGSRPTNPQDCVRLDPRPLIFPGELFGLDEPIPSVRLKRLRRGMFDLAYMALLDARGKGHIAQTMVESLAPRVGSQTYGVHLADGARRGWVDDAGAWSMARRIMADELLGDKGKPQSGSDLPETIRWRRFMEETRSARARVTGTRVRHAMGELDAGTEVDCAVLIENRTRLTLSGDVRFVDLPVGWTAPSRHVASLNPGASRTVMLSAATESLAWDAGGVRELPIVVESDRGPQQELKARLCHLTAAKLLDPLELDGDPREWPTGVGNDASSFVLSAQTEAVEAGASPRTPKQETIAFVGMHDDKLYVALRCALDPKNKPDLRRRPVDVPPDLVPTNAECVEILLDPANSGSPSTADVYRIAIGPGGAFWQAGVATNPPTSNALVWTANIRHAVRVASDHWTAEVEIPLDAFPEHLRRRAVWGLNITRFDGATQEYSNWAGAIGNVYVSRSLGNLSIP